VCESLARHIEDQRKCYITFTVHRITEGYFKRHWIHVTAEKTPRQNKSNLSVRLQKFLRKIKSVA